MTVREAKKMLIEKLDNISDSASFEANELLCAALSADKNKMLYMSQNELKPSEQRRLNGYIKKRKKGIPLQYILGEWEFYSLPFYVGRGVLIPRADSELLVDLALEEIPIGEPQIVFDLCSGSGALSVAISHHRPEAKVIAVEKSLKAFRYLTRNIERNAAKVQPIRDDIFKFNPAKKADIVICNPPYITKKEMLGLEPQVKKEPKAALFGGKDGLKFYRFLSESVGRFLKTGGKIILEIGFKQGKAVAELFVSAGFAEVEVLQDISGNDRVVVATFVG